jgi:ribosomal protein L5
MTLKKFFNNNLKYKLINKFNYKHINNLLVIKKVILVVKTTKYKMQDLALSLLILKLLASIKIKTEIIKTKTQNLLLKIKKGIPIGIKLIIKSSYLIFNILSKLTYVKFRKNKIKFNIKTIKNNFLNFNVKKILNYKKINSFYSLFLNQKLNFTINLIFNNVCKQKLIFFCKYL